MVFTAILLYRITLESGKFEILKDSVGHLTDDRASAGAADRVRVRRVHRRRGGLRHAGGGGRRDADRLGFQPFYAAAICLLANTAPVAFGSIAIPITTLAVITGLPLDR